ncbi:MAG TPA: OmpH family outer membrane protein, partial [Pirellulales bacterium]|nr:OmpH family outer membrane protein [Pirellulales bacterium]
MKQFLSWATLVAALASMHFTASRAAAQQRPAGGAPPTIALIDLQYIFSQHIKLKQMEAELRRDVEAAENELRANNQQLRKMMEQLEGYNRGSPEYKQLEEDITKRNADLQIQVKIQKRDFYEREAKGLYAVYKEVMDQVQHYAEKHGIVMVIQFDGETPDETDSNSIKTEIMKPVVYHSKAIDITPFILDAVSPPARPNRPTPPLT